MEKPGDAYIEEMAKSFWLSKGIDATRITDTDMYRAGFDRCWNTYVVSLESDNKALRDWKESALSVFSEWDRVSDYIKPRCRLGDKYSARALELFKMIDAENKALREEINALNGDIQLYRNGHEVNAKRYNDLLIERNKLKEEIERLKAEVLKEKFPEN